MRARWPTNWGLELLRKSTLLLALLFSVGGALLGSEADAHTPEGPTSVPVDVALRQTEQVHEAPGVHAEEEHLSVGGHCHPGLECSLIAVMAEHKHIDPHRHTTESPAIRIATRSNSTPLSHDPPPPRLFALT
jgi:hypothetical protein